MNTLNGINAANMARLGMNYIKTKGQQLLHNPVNSSSSDTYTPSKQPPLGDQALAMAKRLKEQARANAGRAMAQSKAEHLYKFLNLNEFRDEKQRSSFKVGIVGDSALSEAFAAHNGKRVRGKRIEFVNLKTPEDIKKHNLALLHVDSSSPQRESYLHSARQTSTLTTESVRKGKKPRADIGLQSDGGRVRFQVNVDSVRRAKIKMTPKMTRVASGHLKDSGPGTPATLTR